MPRLWLLLRHPAVVLAVLFVPAYIQLLLSAPEAPPAPADAPAAAQPRPAAPVAAAPGPTAAARPSGAPAAPPAAAPLPHMCHDLALDLQDSGAGLAPAHTLRLNETVRGEVADGEYAYFQLCVEQGHAHEHLLRVRLDVEKGGDANLYLSTELPRPTVFRSTWIARKVGSDSVKLSTTHEDFVAGARMLYIGVHGNRPRSAFAISATVEELPAAAAAAGGRLRGGRLV